ncbi:MAG: tyrosine--tRNA ligase [Phycisphaerales bacterium]|nr:tyrosine--tRNA ligase [Phycisphaerales bacterium]MCB9856750.1 tyrosine--tRNA ligase [Phycisphaerales bacterium]MCB9862123.1 tyrosine--tRNA ligase [Phycisphaerales bacterium]
MATPQLSIDEQIALYKHGAAELFTEPDLRARLKLAATQKRPLRVKLGMDPTAPDIHLGHTVVLRKMRQFQDCGHKAVLIIGDFTARIGDPTGKTKARPQLSAEKIKENAKTYFEQAGHVLDTNPDKLEIVYNSEFLSKLDLADILKLMSCMTVAQMLQRENFKERMKQDVEIVMTELMYPLMQAYDSVMIDADVELGGTDQTFNNLVGRDLMPQYGKPAQIVLTMPILRGLDGVDKMSKSLGNYIAVTDTPKDMFGKTMSIGDDLMPEWFTLLTALSQDDIKLICDPKTTHPREAKVRLAKMVVATYYDEETANREEELWQKVMREGHLRDDVPELIVTADAGATADGTLLFDRASLVIQCGFASTKSEARRLMSQGGIKLDDDALEAVNEPIAVKKGQVLRRGRRQAVKLDPQA